MIGSGRTAESNFTVAFITGSSCTVIETFLTNWIDRYGILLDYIQLDITVKNLLENGDYLADRGRPVSCLADLHEIHPYSISLL